MSNPASKRRVLIIDDSESIHRDFRRVLCPEPFKGRDPLDPLEETLFGTEASSGPTASGLEFELDSAFQGEEGLAKVEQALAGGRPYAVTFLDYRMPPGWNGVQTLRHLWQVDPMMPVVFCSAYSDYSWEELRREFGELHRLVELKKPFNGEELRQLALELAGLQEGGVLGLCLAIFFAPALAVTVVVFMLAAGIVAAWMAHRMEARLYRRPCPSCGAPIRVEASRCVLCRTEVPVAKQLDLRLGGKAQAAIRGAISSVVSTAGRLGRS